MAAMRAAAAKSPIASRHFAHASGDMPSIERTSPAVTKTSRQLAMPSRA
jgi:hypothetical protein